MDIIILFVGFILLMKGADFFVDGASSLASRLKIPSIVVGLTIVSFGTSAPEAAVSVFASISGSNDIALSNVIGSNIFNLLVVLASTALLAKIVVPKNIVKLDFPFLLVISALMILFVQFDYRISSLDGLLFLIIIISYITYLIYLSYKNRKNLQIEEAKLSFVQSILFMILGLAMIVYGGDVTANAAKQIALDFGMSEKLVGLTVVSIGTSLPELITSLVAAKKGQVDIALGNAVGSNIFNILFILGLSGVIAQITVNPQVMMDAYFMLAITLICFIFAKKSKELTWKHGIFLILLFICYLVFIIIRN